MTDKPKRGMAALLAEQQRQVAEQAASPARDASDARAARPSSPGRQVVSAAPPGSTATAAAPARSLRGQAASPARDAGTSRTARAAGPGKAARLRSWYMTPATADALAEAVDDLHHATRAPKYEVLAAIIRHALADLRPVEAELRAQRAAGG